jgi:uncharacterized protein YneF (UPF0154 family)
LKTNTLKKILLSLTALTTPIFVSASSGFFDRFVDIISYEIPVHGLMMKSNIAVPVPAWMYVACFAIIFAIVWLATDYIKIFKEKKGPRTMFAIALSVIALFLTPLVYWIWWLVTIYTVLSVIAILILGAYFIWTITKSEWARNKEINAESNKTMAGASKMNAESDKTNAETDRMKEQTKEYDKKTRKAARDGIHAQVQEIHKIKREIHSVFNDLNRAKSRGTYPVNPYTISKISKNVGNIRMDLGKLLSFITDNDRLLSTMSTSDYSYHASNKMPGLDTSGTPPSNKALIGDLKKETDDLSNTITAMADLLHSKSDDIQKEELGHLLSWTEVAGNIINRMERDIVLETQMIEKLN